MRFTFLLSLIALAAMLAIAPDPGEAQVRAMDLGDLASESTYVVRARIDDRSVYWTENALGNIVVSDFELRVIDVLKGEPRTDAVVQCFGGTIGNFTMEASESARLNIGEDVVLFLVDSPLAENRYQICGAFQGKYQVIDGRVREMQDVTFDEFRADVIRLIK